MRIVVTGKNGQVVQSLLAKADDGFEIIALGRPELDLATPETIYSALAAVQPDLVVSAAAYTAVDIAEDEPDKAFAINAIGAEAVANATRMLNIPIIHISTDYVFDGSNPAPYKETDLPNPQNVYGVSKLEGERLVAEANPRHIILRTSWVYSPYGNNFLKTMLRLAKNQSELKIVSDQFGNPTSALEIASAIFHLLKNNNLNDDFKLWGIYNFTGKETCNWSCFAKLIFEQYSKNNDVNIKVIDILSEDYVTKAKRPLNSALSIDKFINTFNYNHLSMRECVAIVLSDLRDCSG